MSGTYVKFGGARIADQDHITFSVQTSAGDLPEHIDQTLGLDPNDTPFNAVVNMRSDPNTATTIVKDAGKLLFDKIALHPNTNNAVARTITAAAQTENRQIRLEISTKALAARNLPWELLFDANNGFLDMSAGIPVVRALTPAFNATRPPTHLGDDGLRLFFILGAEGIDCAPEWSAIKRALNSYSKPYTVRVYAYENRLITQINAQNDPQVTVFPMPGSVSELKNAIGAFKPQICHFFCHGRSESGGFLEIANARTAMGEPPLYVQPRDLERILPSSAWLVLLNACSGAAADPTAGSSSIASKLVEQGVPIVVGMRQEVTSSTIGLFTKAFLGDALAKISTLLDQNGQAMLDLGPSLNAARAEICTAVQKPIQITAERTKEWSLPVMIVGTEDFYLTPTTTVAPLDHSGLFAEKEMLIKMVEQLAGTLSDTQLGRIDTRIAELSTEIVGLPQAVESG